MGSSTVSLWRMAERAAKAPGGAYVEKVHSVLGSRGGAS